MYPKASERHFFLLCKKTFIQWQVKIAIRESSNRGHFFKRLKQMYPVYDINRSVPTEIEEPPILPEFLTVARISEFVAQLGELVGV